MIERGVDVMSGSIGVETESSVILTNCDLEPIHIIAAVQSVGFLVAVSQDWRIERVSANVATYLGRTAELLLGVRADAVFAPGALHTIRNRLSTLRTPDSVERAFAVQLQPEGPLFDLGIHMAGETIVLEAEPSQPAGELNAGAMVRSMLDRLQDQPSLVREAARLIQALTGFDRVMIYQFHPDDSGEVIAESVRRHLEPYLGLRYPAEDIPRQARALLVRNSIRLLADVGADPSPIIAAQQVSAQPLDLSMSTLRAHSLMHVEYLKNMGVAATMTVSLLRDQKLWGLISCHHMSPHHVGFDQRTTVDLFAQMLAFLIERRERDDLAAYESRTRLVRNRLVTAVVESGWALKNTSEMADQMAKLVPCDGVGVCIDGNVFLSGATPTPAEFEALRRFLDDVAASKIYVTEALGRAYPPAKEFASSIAGLLVVPTSRLPGDYLIFFRQEVARSVTWAGNPSKVAVPGPNGDRLTPRKSFEAWQEIVRGQASPWTEAELRVADALRVTLLEVVLHVTGMTEKERRAATARQELLIAELNHRVRNILALIRGLVAQSRTNAVDVDTFATVLGDRVHALARAHDQITAKAWGPGSLATLIATEAAAYAGLDTDRVLAAGPNVLLQPQAFSTLALVIHELLTNAAKHGALSVQDGRVTCTWGLDDAGDVVLDWRETGGPPVQAPTRRGFGSTIIERSIPHELGGAAAVELAPDGLRGRFTVPARYAVMGVVMGEASAVKAAAALPAQLSGLVLLVEDNMLLALETETIMLALGASQVAVASNVAQALSLIDMQKPDFALLDVNLGTEMSWPVAERLRSLGVQYIFATGYGDGIQYPIAHQSTPFITKPYTSDAIARAAGEARGMS